MQVLGIVISHNDPTEAMSLKSCQYLQYKSCTIITLDISWSITNVSGQVWNVCTVCQLGHVSNNLSRRFWKCTNNANSAKQDKLHSWSCISPRVLTNGLTKKRLVWLMVHNIHDYIAISEFAKGSNPIPRECLIKVREAISTDDRLITNVARLENSREHQQGLWSLDWDVWIIMFVMRCLRRRCTQ